MCLCCAPPSNPSLPRIDFHFGDYFWHCQPCLKATPPTDPRSPYITFYSSISTPFFSIAASYSLFRRAVCLFLFRPSLRLLVPPPLLSPVRETLSVTSAVLDLPSLSQTHSLSFSEGGSPFLPCPERFYSFSRSPTCVGALGLRHLLTF